MPECGFDLRECLMRVREGDEDAARDLMQELYPLVIKIVRSHLPRQTGEEDLAQMIFVKLFSKLEQYSGAFPFTHWVSRIAVNTCLNRLHHEKIRPELRWADLSEEEARVIESLAAQPADLEPDRDLAARDLVEKLLAHLSPPDRLVISLMYLEGKSIQEVRQVTGWNIPVIKVRAFRARRKLKKHLESLLKETTV